MMQTKVRTPPLYSYGVKLNIQCPVNLFRLERDYCSYETYLYSLIGAACLLHWSQINRDCDKRSSPFEHPEIFFDRIANALSWTKGRKNWAPFVLRIFYGSISLSEAADLRYVPISLKVGDLPSHGYSA